MADINARIYWQPGMELTANTFKELANNLYAKQQIANCVANNNRFGILPESPFECQGTFVKNVLEVPGFKCRALLPSGRIIDAEEDVTVKIPMLYGEKYFMTVGFGEEKITFEKKEVTFMRPQYIYEIHTLEEVEKGDLMPVMKFNVTNGRFSIDAEYIPPCMLINGHPGIITFIQQYIETMEAVCHHANLAEGEGKRCMLQYLFRLKSYDPHQSSKDMIVLLEEMAYAIDYHVARPNSSEPPEVIRHNPYDVQIWLKWFDSYLKAITVILDGVVLEEEKVDYGQLKKEIEDELFSRLFGELHDKLMQEIQDRINPNMEQVLRETLKQYIDNELRPQLSQELSEELAKSLEEKLYPTLYQNLYNALFVPTEEKQEEEESTYIPQI
jgi:hypothetical protein